jgi:hypothetical protein
MEVVRRGEKRGRDHSFTDLRRQSHGVTTNLEMKRRLRRKKKLQPYREVKGSGGDKKSRVAYGGGEISRVRILCGEFSCEDLPREIITV